MLQVGKNIKMWQVTPDKAWKVCYMERKVNNRTLKWDALDAAAGKTFGVIVNTSGTYSTSGPLSKSGPR